MFICRDVSKQYLISVYWEDSQLYVVIKSLDLDGFLDEVSALRYTPAAARQLIKDMSQAGPNFQGLQINSLASVAIIGKIAEGLIRHRGQQLPLRSSPGAMN